MTLTLQEATGKNTLLLPFGKSDDGAHSQNEKFDKTNYMSGVSLLLFLFRIQTNESVYNISKLCDAIFTQCL